MSQQVKVPADIKRELELVAGLTGKTQGQLLADVWSEYREQHKNEFRKGLRWANAILRDPNEAAIAASGMSPEDVGEIAGALGDPAPAGTGTEAKA